MNINYDEDWLEESSDKDDIGNFLVLELDVLRKALLQKHKETFWISKEGKIIRGNEYFLNKVVEHKKNPLIDQFEMLIEISAITLDYPIKKEPDGRFIDNGCDFKFKKIPLIYYFLLARFIIF